MSTYCIYTEKLNQSYQGKCLGQFYWLYYISVLPLHPKPVDALNGVNC